MRRWNGWGDTTTDYAVPVNALGWLSEHVGASVPPHDIDLASVLRHVPASTSTIQTPISGEAEERLRHARGQSLPDWIAMRFGRIARFPEGVAYPESEEDLLSLFDYARRNGVVLIPYGGGTSVVGGINPEADGPPAITVDLSRMSALHTLDKISHLATFGAGIKGPNLEAALRNHGFTLGHFPQSFELSTLGGWIATRSSGQQSLYYGRIEQHFAGGRLVTPHGSMEMPPFAASAAGPDLREVVLGSEGRMGIISQATVRITPLPEREEFHAVFFPAWEPAIDAVRRMVQAHILLSMLRLSNPRETEANLTLAGHENLVNLAHRGLQLIGQARGQKCMLLLGITGSIHSVRHAKHAAFDIARHHGGVPVGQYMGKKWAHSRFLTPYLRNTLWKLGYAIDTLETFVPWSDVPRTAQAVSAAIEHALEGTGERVYPFAHLSHVYPTGSSIYTTFIFRVLPDPDQMLEYWRRMKDAASQAIIAHGGTITHQHAIGTDHAPYLAAEKGELGMQMIGTLIRTSDPEGFMNPGKLIRDHRPEWAQEV